MSVVPALSQLDSALSQLWSADPEELSPAAVLTELERLRSGLEAVVDRSAAAFEQAGGHEAVGAASAASFLAFSCRLPRSDAKAQLRRGRALAELPLLAEAFSGGELGTAQASLVASALAEPATRDAALEHEQLLVDQAKTLSFSAFKRAISYFCQLADPDGCDARAEALRARRTLTLSQSFEGSWFGELGLDPLAGAIVSGELERLAKASFEADWAEHKRGLGREPLLGELGRTAAQRRADALVEMARRSAACPDDARYPAPLLSVLVDFPTLAGRVCELANGTVVSPRSLLPYLDEAVIERAVWKGPPRVEVGSRTRLFSGATRRAIELRDRICQHPYCELPADRCQADHIVPFAEGGETTQANGRLACGRHNRMRVHGPQWPCDAPDDEDGSGDIASDGDDAGGPAPP